VIRGAVIFGAGIAVGMYISKNENASLVDMVADMKKTANDLKVAAQTGETTNDTDTGPEGGSAA
jgi:hypothetical protein